MRTALAILLLLPAAVAEEGPPPSPDRIEAAVKDLKSAADDAAKIKAIAAAQGVVAPPVIGAIAKHSHRGADDVRAAAFDALGRMRHKKALAELHKTYRNDKKLREKGLLFTALLKAIGRHRDPSSIDILSDRPFKGLTAPVGKARIYGLGNIRSRKSVEALVKAMRLGGGDPRRAGDKAGSRPFEPYFRTAMIVLTGEDAGATKENWQGWWQDNKSKFKVAERRPDVPVEVRKTWEKYWGEPYRPDAKKELAD